MTKTVTLPKTEFDFMERKLNMFEADFKEQVESEIAEHRDTYANEINKLMAKNFVLSNSSKVLPVFIEDKEKAKQFTSMYGENFNKYSANQIAYTHNRDAFLKLIKNNHNLQDEVSLLTQKLKTERQYGDNMYKYNQSLVKKLDIHKREYLLTSITAKVLGAISIISIACNFF